MQSGWDSRSASAPRSTCASSAWHRSVPLGELRRFLPILWAGFWLNAVSGVLLLIGYPTKALTNPVFYLKLTLIAVAMVLLVRISRQVFATGSGES